MASQYVKDAIKDALGGQENCSVTGDNNGELRRQLKLNCSNEQFGQALGSLVSAGLVEWHRPLPEGRWDNGRPITITLTAALVATA